MTKTALITGGTKGIGKAICNRLLEEGWMVIATFASDHETALAVAGEFEEVYPGRYYTVCADGSSLESLSTLDCFFKDLATHDAQAQQLTFDAVVFNAGITDRSDLQNITPENWRRVFTANLDWPVFLLQALNERIKEGASIVFTGSLMGIQPHAMSLSYGVSKAAVHALVKNLVKFYADRKIRVNAVAPGFVDTEWQVEKPAHIRENINGKIALGRFSTPDELADVYWLLINNTYINGEVVVCDGAYSYK